MREEAIILKKDFKQKEDKFLKEFLDLKKIKNKIEDRLYKQGQSAQTVHMLCQPKSFYDEKHKVAIGYKKHAQSAVYNGHMPVTTNHTPTVIHDSEDTRELAEITRKRMLMRIKSPIKGNLKVAAKKFCQKTKVLAPEFTERDSKAPSIPLTRKKQVTFNNNTQKHGVHQKVQQSNVQVIPSTGVSSSTRACGSKPRSNTKNDRLVKHRLEEEMTTLRISSGPEPKMKVWNRNSFKTRSQSMMSAQNSSGLSSSMSKECLLKGNPSLDLQKLRMNLIFPSDDIFKALNVTPPADSLHPFRVTSSCIQMNTTVPSVHPEDATSTKKDCNPFSFEGKIVVIQTAVPEQRTEGSNPGTNPLVSTEVHEDHFNDGMDMGDTQIPVSKASANSDIIFFFTSAQDGNKLLDDESLSLADDLKKAHDQNQNKSK
ncbi:hypothetical protein Tco_1429888 [Tanacetum coccineum]